MTQKSKTQILTRLQTERRRLDQNFSTLNHADLLRPGVVGDWSVKDVLAHLADWEEHMLIWMERARHGENMDSPDPGLTWDQWNLFNERIYRAHCDQSIEEVLEYFRSVHQKFMEMVETMPDEELLERGRYAFTGKAAVFDWLGLYAAHDKWGKTKIRAWLKDRKQDMGN